MTKVGRRSFVRHANLIKAMGFATLVVAMFFAPLAQGVALSAFEGKPAPVSETVEMDSLARDEVVSLLAR